MRPITELHVARPPKMEWLCAAVLASLARDEFARLLTRKRKKAA